MRALPVPPTLPDDLDAYLAAQEARYADVAAYAKKTICWADAARKQRTPLAVVYLHGFSANRQETAPLADLVAARLGANLFYTRLTGHGRPSHALGDATVEEWLADTVEAMEIARRLGEKIVVIAVSTGATLATWFAAHDQSNDVLAHVLLSPNFMPAKRMAKFVTFPFSRRIIPLLFGKTWRWKPANALHAQYWSGDYPMTANITMMQLVRLVRKADVERIHTPALFFLSPHDQVVNPAETEKMFARFGSKIKQKIYVTDSQDARGHVLAGDVFSPATTPKIASQIVNFLTELPRT